MNDGKGLLRGNWKNTACLLVTLCYACLFLGVCWERQFALVNKSQKAEDLLVILTPAITPAHLLPQLT